MRYRVILPKSVQKILDRLPDEIVKRILARLTGLETNPRPPDVKKLKGRNAWRIRVGEYRVIYEIHDNELQVLIITIGHRGDEMNLTKIDRWFLVQKKEIVDFEEELAGAKN